MSGRAAVPLFLLSSATGGRARHAWRRALVAGGIFFFLVAPAVFLQCHAFTVGGLLAWLGGSIAGSLAGGVTGFWVAAFARSDR